MTINTITFEMTNSNSTQIYLPCETLDSNDLLWEASKAVWENGKDIGDIADITAYLLPHTSRIRPYCGYRVEINTTDGQQIVRHIKADFTTEQIVDILDRFFAAGAPGLSPDIRKLYENQHSQYKNRHLKQSA